ncbi:MAG: long-chain fatty acid--CoA ligase, partial [Bacteroidota bacterium]
KNRVEFTICDLAMAQIGVISVPVYPTISPKEYQFIFNDSGIQYCFAGTGDLYDKVNKAKASLPGLKEIYTLDPQEGRKYYKDLFKPANMAVLEQHRNSIQDTDLATFIYTSGTTGNPKGVMLSHRNIISNLKSVAEIFPIPKGSKVLSFLPMCHVFERTASLAYVTNSFEVVFTGTDNLGGPEGDLATIKPDYFNTVPRLLEKVYDKILQKGLSLSGLKKSLFFWALKLTEDYAYDKKFTGLDKMKWNVADKLIFSKWREALGGNVKGILTGAAPCPEKIARVFSAAGIPIREGYGLTEASPGITINKFTPGDAMLGTVGPVLDGVKIKLDTRGEIYKEGEGEILACGNNIMQGYHNNKTATDGVLHEVDGEIWLSTGDVGKIIEKGGRQFLKITDRKKELLKTSGGKYVAPAPIESRLKESLLVEQVMVVGESRKFVSALIVPSMEGLQSWCETKSVAWKDPNELLKDDTVVQAFQEIVNDVNPDFSHVEQVKKFTLLNATWDPVKEDGSAAELTPTLKLKRRVIREKFNNEINSMYS